MESLSGEFEIHITVQGNRDTLVDWAERHTLKVTKIVLDCGAHPTQLMVTSEGSGTYTDMAVAAERLRRQLCAAGFPPSRVKIEAAPWNRGIPKESVPPGTYFEHHVKLLLSANADLAGLKERVIAHGAHLSRDARRVRPDGMLERFVTQRCYGVGQSRAHAAYLTLLAALEDQTILESEEEFVVYDSAPILDVGWLPEKPKNMEAS